MSVTALGDTCRPSDATDSTVNSVLETMLPNGTNEG